MAERRLGPTTTPSSGVRSQTLRWVLLALGGGAACVAAALDPAAANAAADTDWPPFVLVSGLILVGLVAEEEGVFATLGERLGGLARSGAGLYLAGAACVGVVTVPLNLDTSVAFLTPVFVHAARRRGGAEEPLLYGSLLIANASSLLLVGSNLTNLIVLGPIRLSGAAYAWRILPAAVVAFASTTLVVGVAERRYLGRLRAVETERRRLRVGIGAVAVVAVSVLAVAVSSPALPVAAVGVVVAVAKVARRELRPAHLVAVLGVPVLVGLLGLAVALGTAGRAWSGPAVALAHLDQFATAGLAAVCTVLLNNLPAASLLSARPSPHPLALLVGLNIGPNLAVTGSLSWLLWLRSARAAGSQPSIARATRLGAIAAPVAIVLAVIALGIG